MSYPSNYKYTKDHEWTLAENDTVKVGITEFAQSELGEIVFVELPEIGSEIKKGDSLCVVESTKAASDVYAPLSGKVVSINDKLSEDPSLVNSDPHNEGWMVVLEGSDESENDALMNNEDYQKSI